MTLIKHLQAPDDFTGFYLIKELEVKQTNTTPAKDFMDIVLCDASGQVSAKMWDVSIADKETFFPMTLVKVQGLVQMYRERLQVKIGKIRKALPEDGVQITDFIRSAPISPADLIHTINNVLASITNPTIQSIVSFCVAKVGDKLDHYPAAKTHHHAYFAGLAYHIVRMLELGEFICKQRPFLNADLIKAGIILHDIAKPEEMIAQLGIVSDYSVQGKLLGHISMASNWITEAALHLGSRSSIGPRHWIAAYCIVPPQLAGVGEPCTAAASRGRCASLHRFDGCEAANGRGYAARHTGARTMDADDPRVGK